MAHALVTQFHTRQFRFSRHWRCRCLRERARHTPGAGVWRTPLEHMAGSRKAGGKADLKHFRHGRRRAGGTGRQVGEQRSMPGMQACRAILRSHYPCWRDVSAIAAICCISATAYYHCRCKTAYSSFPASIARAPRLLYLWHRACWCAADARTFLLVLCLRYSRSNIP